MRKYDSLIQKIADTFALYQSSTETDGMYKARIVYSLLGRMAYVSLWDTQEDFLEDEEANEDVSITHLKRRVQNIHESYLDMYPEIIPYLPRHIPEQDVADEIYSLFQRSGIIYKTPYRLNPSIFVMGEANGLYFVRGNPVNLPLHLSGLGGYTKTPYPTAKQVSLAEMFCLHGYNLQQYWKDTVRHSQWMLFQVEEPMEFLEMKEPATSVWSSKPVKNQQPSLMRVGMNGNRLYYLYRYENSELYVSPLPAWQTDAMEYISLAAGCLLSANILPSIRYREDGKLVHIHMTYPLPNAEKNMILLYSWPEDLPHFSPSRRVMNAEVFWAMKDSIEVIGYRFTKE